MQPDRAYSRFFLYPSAFYVNTEPTVVTTLLGTCIAVCIYDMKLQMGGINHYMLPLWNGKGLASAKFGNIATDRIIRKMESLGANKRNMVAKIFGGKDHQGEASTNDVLNIGERNIILAREILKEERIPIQAESVGGMYGRKILFDTYTGKVSMQFVGKK